MQVILKREVQNLGETGDVIVVKDGYARNFLIPQNMAEMATKGALAKREQNIARIKAKQEKLHQEAMEVAKKIEDLGKLEMSVKAGETGKLFGTITTKKISEELKEKTGLDLDRKNISVDSAVNKVGEYRILIKLTSKVKADIALIVNASEVIKNEIIEEEVQEEVKEIKEKKAAKAKKEEAVEETAETAEAPAETEE